MILGVEEDTSLQLIFLIRVLKLVRAVLKGYDVCVLEQWQEDAVRVASGAYAIEEYTEEGLYIGKVGA